MHNAVTHPSPITHPPFSMKTSKKKRKKQSNSVDTSSNASQASTGIIINKKKKLKKSSGKNKCSSVEPISSLCNIVGLSSPVATARTFSNGNSDINVDVNINLSGGMIEEEDPFKFQNNRKQQQQQKQSQSLVDHVKQTTEALEDLDSCLALMDKSFQSAIAFTSDNANGKEEKGKHILEDCIKSNGGDGGDDILWKGYGSTSTSTGQKHSHYIHEKMENFYLPNLQVELARHKNVGELSQFLLSKYKHLRMPTFERWLIDSKMEERAKRIAIEKLKAKNSNIVQDDPFVDSHARKQIKEKKWKERLKRKKQNYNNSDKFDTIDDKVVASLERHLTSSGMKALNDYDWVIPSMADLDDDATQRLIEEIVQEQERDEEKSSSTSDAQSVCRELCQKACIAARSLQNLNQHLGGPMHVDQYLQQLRKKKKSSKSSSNSAIGKIQLKIEDSTNGDDNSSDSYSLVYSRRSNKKANDRKMKPFVIKINAQHYDKLRTMFNSVHVHDYSANRKLQNVPSATITLKRNLNEYTPSTQIFHHLIFCVVVRYSALSGGQQLLDLRGGGMQGAIHSQVFESLSNICQSDSIIECFASPLNVYNREYCSMFHQDLDYHFGSGGDFFTVPLGHFQQKNDCGWNVHEANPPFSPCLMKLMVERLFEHLEHADSQYSIEGGGGDSGQLTFVVVVPTYKSKGDSEDSIVQKYASESFNQMIKCPYFTKHIILKAREHGYVEGSQHLRKTRYKESQYSTSVVILQSRRSREKEVKSPLFTTNEFDVNIRKAFGSRHNLELNERRSQNHTTGPKELKKSKKNKKLQKVKKNVK